MFARKVLVFSLNLFGFIYFTYSGEHDRDSTSKSPAAAQLQTHFFPQQDRPDGNNDVGMDESSDQPRRMYVREEFTHENAVRGNLSELNDGSIKR